MAHIGIEDLEERCEESRKELSDKLDIAGDGDVLKKLRETMEKVKTKMEYLENNRKSWMWALSRRAKYNSVLRDIESMESELDDIKKEQPCANVCSKCNAPFANQQHIDGSSSSLATDKGPHWKRPRCRPSAEIQRLTEKLPQQLITVVPLCDFISPAGSR